MIRVKVDTANPGQIFACCGLLELADKRWPDTQGYFDKEYFCLLPPTKFEGANATSLLDQLAACVLANTMTQGQIHRQEELAKQRKSRLRSAAIEEERKLFERLLREAPIVLGEPFNLTIDWFHDDNAGGSRFKTWAGQQSVLDISSSMKESLQSPDWRTCIADEWFSHAVSGCGLPFNFDSDLGGQGSALDIGFSFDPLAGNAMTRIESSARPCLELLAFIGLQRFRPRQLKNENRYLYCAWNQPLTPEIAAPAACGLLPMAGAPRFEFRLLYRTKYLKSFLPAIPFFGDSDE